MTEYFRYHADPSGTFMRFDAKAIGSGAEGAQTELQEQYHKVTRNPETDFFPLTVFFQSL